MVHPLLFLQFISSKLQSLLHIGDAAASAIVYTWLIIALLFILSKLATGSMKLVPSGIQNFMEVVIDGVENMIVETMGEHGRSFFPADSDSGNLHSGIQPDRPDSRFLPTYGQH